MEENLPIVHFLSTADATHPPVRASFPSVATGEDIADHITRLFPPRTQFAVKTLTEQGYEVNIPLALAVEQIQKGASLLLALAPSQHSYGK